MSESSQVAAGTPITACDAQFNHLLEQRSQIARELACMTKT